MIRISTLAAVLALSACQPMPQPFAPTRANPLLEITDGGGITIQSVIGVRPEIADRIAGEVAAALRELDIPAATEGHNRRSRFLTGEVEERRLPDGRVRVGLRWTLVDRGGQEIASRVTGDTLGRPLEAEPDPLVVRRLARASAAEIAAVMRANPEETASAAAPTPSPTPALRSASIFIRPITGAPGDGARNLQFALAQALRAQRLAVVENATAAGYTVAGTIALAAPDAGLQQVELAWSVLGPDGREIGNLKQQNAVPPGTFDRPWGELAGLIAQTVAEGIVELFDKIADPELRPARARGS